MNNLFGPFSQVDLVIPQGGKDMKEIIKLKRVTLRIEYFESGDHGRFNMHAFQKFLSNVTIVLELPSSSKYAIPGFSKKRDSGEKQVYMKENLICFSHWFMRSNRRLLLIEK